MIRLRTLGECAIEVGERRVGPEAGHVFAMLLFLAVERGKHVSRATLVEHFWPGASDEKARHCLRQALYKVRQLGVPVDATASHVELEASVVTGDFLRLAEDGRVDVDRLRVGGAAFGEFLPGYAPAFSPAFAEWLEAKRDFVHAQVRRALAVALVECRSAHRWADVDAVARYCLQLDPLNEEATLALAEATALAGSKAQALSMLDRFVAELGPDAGDIRLPATLLRKRIAERLPTRHYTAASDALFVGRDADLAVLGGLVREVRAGRGQACIVWGEPGIGKSRLATECAKGAALQGAVVQRVGCQASDAVRPLSVFVDVVPKLQTMPGALGCSPESLAYLRRLTEHDTKSTAPPSEEAQEAAYLHARIRRALLDLLDAIAEESPLVIVVEDVHWLDAPSWDVFREMIDWAAERRIFFLFTSRTATPTEQAAPRMPRRLVAHHLGALDSASSAALLEAIVRDHQRTLDGGFRDWCVGVSEGNPLFLREIASQWLETGDPSQVPVTLKAVIGERLTRLRPSSMRLLQASAILGKNSTFERLEAVTDYKKFELLDAVEELEAAGLLVAGGGAGVQVRHELIARAALDRINEGVRRLLHRNSARVLEAEIEATKSAALLWDYTAHCRAAGEPERVGRVITAVGKHLIDMGLPSDAAAVYRTALKDSTTAEHRRPLLEGLCDALRLAGLWLQLCPAISELINTDIELSPLATTHTDEELALFEAEWRSSGRKGNPATMLLRIMSCVDDDRAEPNHRVRASALAMRIADNQLDRIAFERAYRCMISLTDQASTSRQHVLSAHIMYHTTVGDLGLAWQHANELIETERRSGSPRTLVRALGYSAYPARALGLLNEAETRLREAFAIASKSRLAAAAMNEAEFLCHMALERGDLDSARRWHSEATEWAKRSEDLLTREELIYAAARISIAEGDLADARQQLNYDLKASEDDPDIRRRVALTTLWLFLNSDSLVDRGWTHTRDLAVSLHKRVREYGGQDFPLYCLFRAMVQHKEEGAAYSLLHEYTAHRREQGPLPPYLNVLLI